MSNFGQRVKTCLVLRSNDCSMPRTIIPPLSLSQPQIIATARGVNGWASFSISDLSWMSASSSVTRYPVVKLVKAGAQEKCKMAVGRRSIKVVRKKWGYWPVFPAHEMRSRRWAINPSSSRSMSLSGSWVQAKRDAKIRSFVSRTGNRTEDHQRICIRV